MKTLLFSWCYLMVWMVNFNTVDAQTTSVTETTCSHVCQTGGVCISNDGGVQSFSCPATFTGDDCSNPVCTPACQNGGTCIINNEGNPQCLCVTIVYGDAKYYGEDCSIVRQMYDVRLIGGTGPWEGLLEMWQSVSWEGMCENHNGYHIRNAHVICHQLGYGYALERPNPNDFDSRVIRPDGVVDFPRFATLRQDCIGLEAELDDCTGNWYPSNECLRSYDLFAVRCNKTAYSDITVGSDVRITDTINDTTLGTGHVEVLYQNFWYRVCNDSWDLNDANVVCRQLGFDYALPTEHQTETNRKLGLYAVITDVGCSGEESSLSECGNANPGWHLCFWMNDATVSCRYNASPNLDPEAPLRLVNGRNYREGLVQIYHDDKWWTLCDTLWDMADALVICKQLGFNSATNALGRQERLHRFPVFDDIGSNNLGILINWLDCVGTEDNLAECRHSPLGQHQCGHRQDVAVVCSYDRVITLPIPIFSVRLAGGSNDLEGAVEVYHRDNHEGVNFMYSRICSIGWDMNDANVICRQLNFSYALKAVLHSEFGEPERDIVQRVSEVNCTGDEISIGLCKLKLFDVKDCTEEQEAGVICSKSAPDDFEGRLESMKGEKEANQLSEGFVRIKQGNNYYFVCAESWDAVDANVFCRSLGYGQSKGSAKAASLSSWDAEDLVAIMSQVKCTSTEEKLVECNHTFGLQSCPDNQFATTKCIKGAAPGDPQPLDTLLVLFTALYWTLTLRNEFWSF